MASLLANSERSERPAIQSHRRSWNFPRCGAPLYHIWSRLSIASTKSPQFNIQFWNTDRSDYFCVILWRFYGFVHIWSILGLDSGIMGLRPTNRQSPAGRGCKRVPNVRNQRGGQNDHHEEHQPHRQQSSRKSAQLLIRF